MKRKDSTKKNISSGPEAHLPSLVSDTESACRNGIESWKPGTIAADSQVGHSSVVDRGLRLALSGDSRDAARYLKEALVADPDNGAAWNNLGVLYLENGASGPAVDCFRRAVAHDEELSTAWLNLGLSLLRVGDVSAADRCLRRVVASQAGNRLAWEGLAEVNRRAGAMDEAVLCWHRAGRKDMDRSSAWVLSADELLDNDDATGAVGCLKRALADGDHASIWARLGYAHSLLGENAAAVRSYRRALELEPERPSVHYNLAVMLIAQGRLREARRHLEQAVRQNDTDAHAWNNLGHVLSELGLTDRARQCFERALDEDPDRHEAWNNLGGWYEQQGDGRAATAGFSRAVELQPGNAEYLLNRATMLAKMGESEGAVRDLDELCRTQPELRAMLWDLPAFSNLDRQGRRRDSA